MSPDQKPTKPVGIYVRVSRVGGRDVEAEGGTAAEQEKRCRAQLVADGLEAGEVHVDLDESGGATSRPAFDEVMKRIASGQYGGVVVYNLKRFGRRTGFATTIIEIEKAGAVFISCQEKFDTSTVAGRAMLRIFAALAEMELEERTEGFQRARESAVERGIHVSSRVPAGYVRGEDRVLVPSQDAPAVRAAFEARADGATWLQVAAILTDAGVVKSRETDGPVWSEAAAAALCENRVYLGEARSGKDFVKTDAHEAIVDAGLFARVQARKTERGSFVDPTRRRELLAGLVRCGSCGAAMVVQQQTKRRANGDRYDAFWRCSGRCKNAAGVAIPALDTFVLDFLGHIGTDDQFDAYYRSPDTGVKAAQIRLDNAQAALDDLVANADISKGSSAVLALIDRAERERDEAAAALNEVAEDDADDESIAALVTEFRSSGREGRVLPWLIERINETDNARARKLIRQFVVRVTVTKATSKRQPLGERVVVDVP